MAAPVTLHVVRPYASEAELIAREGWTIDAKGMLLVEQDALPPETVVRFDVALADGTKLVVAEGKVAGTAAPEGDRPGGLRVRFKRFGATTKAFIDRALAERSRPAGDPPSSRPEETSGIHVKPVPAPPDRDALLARLRGRARGVAKVVPSPEADEDAG